jgi:hypothetical protein
MSEAAAQRLRAYCRRAIYSRSDVSDNGLGRDVRVVNADLRKLIWRDAEVCDVLLRAGEDRNAWDALLGQVDVLGQVDDEHGLPLLDLVSAMSLEARQGSLRWASAGHPIPRRQILGR